MNLAGIAAVRSWVTEAGLAGTSEPELLKGFCERLTAAGLQVARGTVVIDTLHPVYEGRVFRWRHDQQELPPVHEYGRTEDDVATADSWRRSPFYHLLQTGDGSLRRNLRRDRIDDFPILGEYQAEGLTDYLAMIHRFASGAAIGEMDCVYSSWTSEHKGGYSDEQVAILEEIVPTLALAVKCTSLTRIAETLVETYLGRDAGRRVLSGRIARGVADRIEAVLWYSDLRGFTRITDTAPPAQIIPLLNDYADAVISSIHEQGGDVLKLIGDGTLAIFAATDAREACRSALAAEALARQRIATLNARRAAEGMPVTEVYLGLHIGTVFYGNVGSRERLDFTVVGPAVNEVSRIAAMCRSAERDILMSSAFAAAAQESDPARLVSAGRYALRGVEAPQHLYTLDRGIG